MFIIVENYCWLKSWREEFIMALIDMYLQTPISGASSEWYDGVTSSGCDGIMGLFTLTWEWGKWFVLSAFHPRDEFFENVYLLAALRMIFLCPFMKMIRGHWVFALSVLPSFCTIEVCFLNSYILALIGMKLGKIFSRSLDVHLGRWFCSENFVRVMALDTYKFYKF